MNSFYFSFLAFLPVRIAVSIPLPQSQIAARRLSAVSQKLLLEQANLQVPNHPLQFWQVSVFVLNLYKIDFVWLSKPKRYIHQVTYQYKLYPQLLCFSGSGNNEVFTYGLDSLLSFTVFPSLSHIQSTTVHNPEFIPRCSQLWDERIKEIVIP